MGWFSWTRKNKPKTTPEPVLESLPQTLHQRALVEKFVEEINKLYQQRNTRRMKWIRKINRPMNLNNPNSYIFSPYENEAVVYLVGVLRALEKDPNPFFFNEAYAEFLRTKNDYVKTNTNIFPKRAKSVPLINSVLRKMRVYSKQLNMNTNNWNHRTPTPRPRIESFHSFSNTETNTNINTSVSTLPSLQQLRNNTRYTPKKRLQGRIVKPNLNRPPPEEV
jgi:hypothetical protein